MSQVEDGGRNARFDDLIVSGFHVIAVYVVPGEYIDEESAGLFICTMHPDDAKVRGILDGDIVRLHNNRGACLACVTLSDDVMPGVLRLPTGAWYDPTMDAAGRTPCAHGNPNVLTRDLGTSSLAQGCTGQRTAVEVERLEGEPPPVRAFEAPASGPS